MIPCEWCRTSFTPKHPKGRFCSSRCRSKSWRVGREQELREAVDAATRALERARATLGRKRLTESGPVG